MAKPPGDWRQIAKLIQSTGRIASRELVKKSIRTFGSVAYDLAKKGAAAGMSPTLRKWKPLKGGGRALAGIASTLRYTPSSTGFKIATNFSHAWIQQKGGRRRGTLWKLPARRILPKRALPKQWRTPIVERLESDWYGNFGRKG